MCFFFLGIWITYLTCYYGGALPGPLALIKKLLVYSIATGRVLSGIFYIPIGMLFAKRTIDKRLCWFLLIWGFISNFFITDLSIGAVFVAISSIGLLGVVEGIQFADSDFFPFVRKMSIVIYLIHMYVWTFYYGIMYREKTYGMDCFAVTVLISSLIAVAYVCLKNNIGRRKDVLTDMVTPEKDRFSA